MSESFELPNGSLESTAPSHEEQLMLVNQIQLELMEAYMNVHALPSENAVAAEWISKYAEKFRNIFDAHPELSVQCFTAYDECVERIKNELYGQ